MKLSIIVPVYNEFLILDELAKRLIDAVTPVVGDDFEIIMVNDGSRDESLLKLRQLSAQYPPLNFINFSRNFGHQIAVAAGLDHCKGKMVVIIDGDLQDPPELIPELIAKYEEGYEVVYARRNKREGETFFKKVTAKWFYRILRKITNIDIPLDTGDFRLIDEKVVHALRSMPEQNKFYRGQIAWLGFNQTAVLFDRNERKAGVTGYTFKKMLNFALDGITSFSDAPLKLATRLGFIFSSVAFLVIIYALAMHLMYEHTITGWTSLIVSTAFFGGIQLLSLGILGEYISRMNKNVRKRPLYIIAESTIENRDEWPKQGV